MKKIKANIALGLDIDFYCGLPSFICASEIY